MADEYATEILRVATAQICHNHGFTATSSVAFDLTLDLLKRRLAGLCQRLRAVSDHAYRCEPTIDDVGLLCQEDCFPVSEIQDYVSQVHQVPCVQKVPAFPVRKPRAAPLFDVVSEEELKERKAHIPSYFPPQRPKVSDLGTPVVNGAASPTKSPDGKVTAARLWHHRSTSQQETAKRKNRSAAGELPDFAGMDAIQLGLVKLAPEPKRIVTPPPAPAFTPLLLKPSFLIPPANDDRKAVSDYEDITPTIVLPPVEAASLSTTVRPVSPLALTSTSLEEGEILSPVVPIGDNSIDDAIACVLTGTSEQAAATASKTTLRPVPKISPILIDTAKDQKSVQKDSPKKKQSPDKISEQLAKISKSARKVPGEFVTEKLRAKILKLKEKRVADRQKLEQQLQEKYRPISAKKAVVKIPPLPQMHSFPAPVTLPPPVTASSDIVDLVTSAAVSTPQVVLPAAKNVAAAVEKVTPPPVVASAERAIPKLTLQKVKPLKIDFKKKHHHHKRKHESHSSPHKTKATATTVDELKAAKKRRKLEEKMKRKKEKLSKSPEVRSESHSKSKKTESKPAATVVAEPTKPAVPIPDKETPKESLKVPKITINLAGVKTTTTDVLPSPPSVAVDPVVVPLPKPPSSPPKNTDVTASPSAGVKLKIKLGRRSPALSYSTTTTTKEPSPPPPIVQKEPEQQLRVPVLKLGLGRPLTSVAPVTDGATPPPRTPSPSRSDSPDDPFDDAPPPATAAVATAVDVSDRLTLRLSPPVISPVATKLSAPAKSEQPPSSSKSADKSKKKQSPPFVANPKPSDSSSSKKPPMPVPKAHATAVVKKQRPSTSAVSSPVVRLSSAGSKPTLAAVLNLSSSTKKKKGKKSKKPSTSVIDLNSTKDDDEEEGDVDVSVDDAVWVCPICDVAYKDGQDDMIGCDRCDNWYHWVCVGMITPPPADQQWYCSRCGSAPGKRKPSSSTSSPVVGTPGSAKRRKASTASAKHKKKK